MSPLIFPSSRLLSDESVAVLPFSSSSSVPFPRLLTSLRSTQQLLTAFCPFDASLPTPSSPFASRSKRFSNSGDRQQIVERHRRLLFDARSAVIQHLARNEVTSPQPTTAGVPLCCHSSPPFSSSLPPFISPWDSIHPPSSDTLPLLSCSVFNFCWRTRRKPPFHFLCLHILWIKQQTHISAQMMMTTTTIATTTTTGDEYYDFVPILSFRQTSPSYVAEWFHARTLEPTHTYIHNLYAHVYTPLNERTILQT